MLQFSLAQIFIRIRICAPAGGHISFCRQPASPALALLRKSEAQAGGAQAHPLLHWQSLSSYKHKIVHLLLQAALLRSERLELLLQRLERGGRNAHVLPLLPRALALLRPLLLQLRSPALLDILSASILHCLNLIYLESPSSHFQSRLQG